MKIAIGSKILNLEELFVISRYNSTSSSSTEVEVAVDSEKYAELDKAP